MNTKLKKAISAVLVFSITSFLFSCGQTGSSGKKNKQVLVDSPWFEGELIDIDVNIDSNRLLEYLDNEFVGADDKYIVLFSDGSYKVNDWSQVKKNSDFAIKQITIIDRSTKQIYKTIDLYNILNATDWPEQAIYCNGQLIVKCNSWESDTDEYFNKDFHIDIDSERIIETRKFDLNKNVYSTGIFEVGEYRIEVLCDQQSEFRSYILRVYLPNGDIREFDIKKTGKDLYGIPSIFALDKTMVLIPVELEREYAFYTLDLASNKLNEANTKDYEWLDINKLQHSYNSPDGKVYYTTPMGVSMIDIKNKTVEQVIDYNCCNVNRQYLADLEIAACSSDTFLLCGQYRTTNMFTSLFVNNFAIVEFRKVDKNPHAGKSIIELYVPDSEVDAIISDAIIKFNNSNKEYYIELSNRYDRRGYLNYSEIKSLDDYDSVQLYANANLSNDLAIDLMNGDGPDILLNTSSLGQLNNDNYLIDLSRYFDEIDSNKYFTNIIEGSKTDGKLYQLPISFTIEGIQTDPEYAGRTGIGFAPDEYKEFLYETLNGKDIIESGQALYFVKLFNGMSDKFIVNGKVDLTSSDFEDIAGYVRDNVQQDSLSWDTISDENIEPMDFTTKGNKIAYYCNCPGISGYLVKRAQINNGTAILGIPSSDGRGPMFGTDVSIAVSSHAVNIDACVEFMKILLSDDVQNELVMNDKLVLNRDAFRNGCNVAVEYFNTEEGSQNMFDYAAGTYVTSHMKFSGEDIDNLEEIILSCTKSNASDPAISAILIEEMPAYFLGQKDLTSVVTIIQDRVQKVLDERG